MNRTAWTWTAFCAAAIILLAVMGFFTVAVLRYERAAAMADAHAAMEETVRLALWRMDSTAALMFGGRSRPGVADNNSTALNFNNMAAPQRADPMVQQAMSEQEFRNRAFLGQHGGDLQKIEPVLLDRISDILPGATLEDVATTQPDPADTRRLASIPARLVVPASALPVVDLPWNTLPRISLMIAWGFTLLATAAVARLLAGTLALSERRGAFASAVTHELRTPLTTCRMYAEMLATGMVSDPAVRQQYLNTLLAESDRLGQLIENVLAYARLERRIAPAKAQHLSLPELFERVMPGLQRRAAQAGLKLCAQMPEDLDRYSCRADPVAVEQILLNLVDNACKYGKSDVELKVGISRGKFNCAIGDSGPGLSDVQMKKLFTAFSKSRSDTNPGIGLGLYLSRRLARDMDGDVRYEAGNPGAIFTMSLSCGLRTGESSAL